MASDIREIKETLWEFNTHNAEIFQQEISKISDKKQLQKIKKALVTAKELYNVIRFNNYTEILEKLDFHKMKQLLAEVERHIGIINQREALENGTDTTMLLNEAIEDIIFVFRKRGEEELKLADDLKEALRKARESLRDNFDKKDPEFVTLKEELERIFKKGNLDEITQEEMKVNIPFLRKIYDAAKELNRKNALLNFVVSNVIRSYEIDESQTILIEKSDVIIATPEKIDLLFRTEPEFFENISIVIIDKGHIVGNNDARAFLLELLISKLKYKLESNETRFIFISAVVPDNSLKNLSLWISSSKNNIIQCNKYLDEKQWQSTNRIIGKVTWSSTKKRRDKTVSSYGNATIEYPEIKIDDSNNIAWASKVIQAREYKKTKKDGTLYSKGKIFPADDKGDISVELAYKYSDEGPVLIFTSLPNNVLSLADRFIEMLELKSRDVSNLILEYYKSNTNKDSYITALEWFGEEHTVTKAIKLGIGIHYGDMPEAVRKAVEKDFRNRKLRVLIATSTIAQGVNFPIKTIIVHSLIIFYSEAEKN